MKLFFYTQSAVYNLFKRICIISRKLLLTAQLRLHLKPKNLRNVSEPKAIKTEDTDSITRKLIENDETAAQILDLIREGEIIRAEKLILASVYGSLYEGDQELILAMKTQAFIELIKKRNEGYADQSSAILELGESIADLASGIKNLTPKIKQKVQGALFLSYVTNIWSEEHAYLLKEDERTKVADLIKAIFAIYEAYEALKKANEALKKAKEA
ncbi:hypothetical protein Ddc_10697 [Ditylenchus destructor]|nr:hypothetical protein Ddc_10697 [Ditylenchus destructor]